MRLSCQKEHRLTSKEEWDLVQFHRKQNEYTVGWNEALETIESMISFHPRKDEHDLSNMSRMIKSLKRPL